MAKNICRGASGCLEAIKRANNLYHQLVIVVGRPGSGKTEMLARVSIETVSPIINVNLELSRALLELTMRQRALRAPALMEDIARKQGGELLLLDNTELLFDSSMHLNPLAIFQKLSRKRTVVATWCGELTGDSITYAAFGHPEYRKYLVKDFLVVLPSGE